MVWGGEGPRIHIWNIHIWKGNVHPTLWSSLPQSKGWGTSMECNQGAFAEAMNHAVSNRLDLFTQRQFSYICRGRASVWKHALMV